MTAEEARAMLIYDPNSGSLIWKVTKGGRRAGTIAGTAQSAGYRYVSGYLSHRLIWLIVYGEWPAADIDHINGMRDDNRLENLRSVSRQINSENQRSCHKRSKSGVLGVVPSNRSPRRWQAQIRAGGRNRSLGNYETLEEAHAAYVTAKRKLHAGGTL